MLAACSLFTDLSGFSEATPSVEGGGGNPVDVVVGPDAPSTTDGPGTIVPPDGAVPSPCLSAHKFCDDFDAPNLVLPGKWDAKREAAGPLGLDTTAFASAPRSLRVSVIAGSGKRDSYVEVGFATAAKSLELAYDLRIGAFSSDAYEEIDFGLLTFEPNPLGIQDQGVTIIQYRDRAVFEYFRHLDAGSYESEELPIALPKDKWQHVAMKIDFTTNPVATLRLDGKPVASLPLKTATLKSIHTQVGVNYTNDVSFSATVNIDNVTIDEL
jgi:hypothetical protein